MGGDEAEETYDGLYLFDKQYPRKLAQPFHAPQVTARARARAHTHTRRQTASKTDGHKETHILECTQCLSLARPLFLRLSRALSSVSPSLPLSLSPSPPLSLSPSLPLPLSPCRPPFHLCPPPFLPRQLPRTSSSKTMRSCSIVNMRRNISSAHSSY